MDVSISVNHDSILLVTLAVNLNVTHDFFFSFFCNTHPISQHFLLAFLQKHSESHHFPMSTVTILTNPPSYLAWISAHKFLTDITASTLHQPYPHRVNSPHSSQCNPLRTYVRSQPLLMLHNYFPHTWLKAKVLTPTSKLLPHLSIIISCYFHAYQPAPNSLALLLLFRPGEHTSVSEVFPLLLPLPGAVFFQVYARFIL